MPEEEMRPQGCWLSLEKEAAALVGETRLVRRVQLLFERITSFPRKIALERSRWMEVCEEVKLNEVIRKVGRRATQEARGRHKKAASSVRQFEGPHSGVCTKASSCHVCWWCFAGICLDYATDPHLTWQYTTASLQLVPSLCSCSSSPACPSPQRRSLGLDLSKRQQLVFSCRDT